MLCGLGGMYRCPILLKIELVLSSFLEYISQFWKHMVLQHVIVFHRVYTPPIAPKHLFFLTSSTRDKVQWTLSIVRYSCIGMYLLLFLYTLPNRSLMLLCPYFLFTFTVQKIINPYFAITEYYLFPISCPMCFAELHSFAFHVLG